MSGLNLRLGLIMLLLCRCTFDPQTIAPDGGALRDASVDAAGCDDFKCAGILAFGNKTDANVATQCAEYLTDLQPSPVCGGCACQSVKSDCLVTASTWSDAACTTGLVDRKTTGNTGNVSMSTYDRINGYVKVDGVATSCTVDPAVKGGPTYAAKKNYLCNYFGTCSDLSCAAATEAQCVLVAEGYAVDVVRTVEDAAFMGAENPYDAIVLDRNLPDGDGLVAIRELRGQGVRAPVLVITARGTIDDRISDLEDRVSGVEKRLIQKYATLETLMSRLQAQGASVSRSL